MQARGVASGNLSGARDVILCGIRDGAEGCHHGRPICQIDPWAWHRLASRGAPVMAPILLWLILVLCLLITVVKYLMGIIMRFSFPSTKAQKDYSYEPTVSVLMPCYNEGRTVRSP